MYEIIVSIFPSYKCNQNCKFCYLYNNHNSQLLDLNILRERLKEIEKYFKIHKFNLYGGEITLLDESYLKELNTIIESYKIPNFFTSNLYDLEKIKIFKNSILSTSLNKERPDYGYIKNILKNNILGKKVSVLSMITPSIIKEDPKQILDEYKDLNIDYVCFIKYYPSINTGDVFNISQEVYEQALINLTKVYMENEYDYQLGHICGLNECIKRNYPIATNDQCIRIGPDGRLGAIYYTADNLEYFKWYEKIEDYIEDCNKERSMYNRKCGFCKYYGNCWTEHITNLKCDGCKNLLKWWEEYNDR